MGVKLIILLALVVGVLYCLHLLVQDYQAVTAAPRLLRFLFKRDLSIQNVTRPNVRWRRILLHDPIQCARYLYCDLGATTVDNEVRRGFIVMLSLEPREEDRTALEVFKKAYNQGRLSTRAEQCRLIYPMCPFKASLLFEVVQYLMRHTTKVEP